MAERTRRRRTAARSESTGGEGRLNRDYSGEEYREPGEGYNGEQPTKGLYSCKLVAINDHETAEGNESVKWTFELLPGSENKHGDDVSGWRDYQYTNDDTTVWREQQIAVALGLCKPGGKLTGTFSNLLKRAKPCTVRVGTERYIPEDGGDPETKGRMQAFMPLKDASATKSRRSKRDEDPDEEDVFDDDGDVGDVDDADEDEPEEKPARRTSARSRRKAAEPEPDPEDEEGDEDEPYDADELAAELEDLTLAQLKKRARDEFEIKITRGMKADDIIDAVLDTLDEEEEEEEEEPPPPPKRRSRASSRSSSKKRGSTEEPPF